MATNPETGTHPLFERASDRTSESASHGKEAVQRRGIARGDFPRANEATGGPIHAKASEVARHRQQIQARRHRQRRVIQHRRRS